jgi:hypothetical protein
MSKPCMAVTLVNPQKSGEAGSYLWCRLDRHSGSHLCYSGVAWLSDELVEPTANMILWRTGVETSVQAVSGRMMG